MANIIKFPAYPSGQWKIRQRIESLRDIMGWDMNHCLAYAFKNPAEAWPLLDNRELGIILEYIEGEYLAFQYEKKGPAPAKPVQENSKAKRPARICVFPVMPQVAARQASVKAAKIPKAARASKQAGHVVGTPSNKAAFIRKIKKTQRDLEKTLPHFNDGSYRAILQEQFGVKSSTALEYPELVRLLLYMQALPLQAMTQCKPSGDAPELLHYDAKGLNRHLLMQSVQAALTLKGKTEGKYVGWNYALGILKRQTGGVVACWDDAMPEHLNAVIAALDRDARRNGRRRVR